MSSYSNSSVVGRPEAGVTGVILAGGQSTRMGTNKALLPYHGRPLIQIVAQIMTDVFSRVVLSVRDAQSFPRLNLPEIVDDWADNGPLGGIASVLQSERSPIFCVACDMPFLSRELIRFLSSIEGFDAVIPVWREKPQGLHARYDPSLLHNLKQALASRQLRITDALHSSNVRWVTEEEIRQFDPEGKSFENINYPDDYIALQ